MARYYLPATPLSCDCQELISGPDDDYASLCGLHAASLGDETATQIIGITRGVTDIAESILDPDAAKRRAEADKKTDTNYTPVIIGVGIGAAALLAFAVLMRR